MASTPADEAARGLLALLLDNAPRSAYDDWLAALPEAEQERQAPALSQALLLREQVDRLRTRERELSALHDSAHDLTALADLDTVLAAIVRRARQLLRADMTYLSLNDEVEGASYMKVTDGALTPEFRRLRLPLGTGLLGLVAQTGEPYFTEDYQADARFLHRDYIDDAVAGEQIRAILGVPLTVEGEVIGALLAVHRSVRRFPASEVALLSSFAAHAAIALQNARLFEETRRAADDLDRANRELQRRTESTERAARAHDRLTDVVLHGGGVVEVAQVLTDTLGGAVVVHEVGDELSPAVAEALGQALATGRCAPVEGRDRTWVAAAASGDDHLGTLVLQATEDLGLAERRTLERAALVTALVLVFARVEAEAADRVRGELLDDLVTGAEDDEVRLRERAGRQGADLDRDLVVAVADLQEPDRIRRVTQQGRDLARDLGGLSGPHRGRVVVILPGDDAAGIAEDVRRRLGSGVSVGAAPARGAADVARAHAEALRVVGALRMLGRTGQSSDPAGLGLARLLLHGEPAALEEYLARSIGPLVEYDARRGSSLVDTLAAWFESGGSPVRAAETLGVHPNTVTQRLDRIATLIGDDWRDPARALDLHVALRLRSLQAGM